MIILENQIVSPLLLETAMARKIPIYYSTDERAIVLEENARVLTNSESCLRILDKFSPAHPFVATSQLLKNKAEFRTLLSAAMPDYYFQLVTLEQLLSMESEAIPFPVVVKPNKGYSSIGVYIVKNEQEWDAAVQSLYADLLLIKNTYSSDVINGEEILIEAFIEGDEYAADCYFDESGKPVTLNILKRRFLHEKDTSDRIYYTSVPIIQEIKEELEAFLLELNKHMKIQNYPFHIEVRLSPNGIMPIEVNPLRFAGAGTTDISYHAYGINGAGAYFSGQEPAWDTVLSQDEDWFYGFFCAEIPMEITKNLIASIDHDRLYKEFSHVMEYRKINASNDRTFAVVFFKTKDMSEIDYLLELDLAQYMTQSKQETPV